MDITPDIDVLRYEFEYTGEEMRFWIDSWNLPKHPRWSEKWFEPNTSGQTFFMRIMEKLDKCTMKKTLNLFVNEENIIIVFTLIQHLIYGILGSFACILQ